MTPFPGLAQVSREATRARISASACSTAQRPVLQPGKLRALVAGSVGIFPGLTAPLDQLALLQMRSVERHTLTEVADMLPALSVLDIQSFQGKKLELGNLTGLRVLTVRSCPQLKELRYISGLTGLRELRLWCVVIACMLCITCATAQPSACDTSS